MPVRLGQDRQARRFFDGFTGAGDKRACAGDVPKPRQCSARLTMTLPLKGGSALGRRDRMGVSAGTPANSVAAPPSASQNGDDPSPRWSNVVANRIYTYFERLVAALLLFGMAVVIILATSSFMQSVGEAAINSGVPLDYTSFQQLFDRVLAAIIALELAHSVHQMAMGHRGVSQVKTVIVIGLLAIVRKLILVDIESTSGLFLLGIAATILSLGIVFALVRWVDSRRPAGEAVATPGAVANGTKPNPAE